DALHVPPVARGWFLRSAVAWERAGSAVATPFAGVHIVEATKQVYCAVPARRQRARVVAALEPALVAFPGRWLGLPGSRRHGLLGRKTVPTLRGRCGSSPAREPRDQSSRVEGPSPPSPPPPPPPCMSGRGPRWRRRRRCRGKRSGWLSWPFWPWLGPG